MEEEKFWHAWTHFILATTDEEAEYWINVMVEIHQSNPDLFSDPRGWHAYQTARKNKEQAAS
jgi:hypothetical protein